MAKLTIEELEKLRESAKDKMRLRESEGVRGKITVHLGTCGIAAGGRQILTTLLNEVEKKSIKDIFISTAGCAGLCSREPMVTVELYGQPPVKYVQLTSDKIKRVFYDHVLNGEIVQEYALAIGSERLG